MANLTSNSSLIALTDPTFGVVDYIVFVIFLCISGAVGIFFSVRGQRNTDDYFFGSKKMRPVPVGISSGISFASSAMIVGGTAEVFINGYSMMFGAVFGTAGVFLGCVIVASTLQPLGMTNVNQYLDRRFGSKTLTYTANIMVLLCIFHYMGICMLGSVIAFSSVTGGQVSVVSGLVIGGVVGIFYTSIGGLKAVVWTDVIQSGIMVTGFVTVIIKAIVDTPGGISEIVRLNVEYGRLHPPVWTFDVTVRHTMWGLMFGYFVYYGIYCVQPASVQRLCSTKSKKDSYIIAAVGSSIFFIFGVLPALSGMSLFGYFASRGCDVHAAGWIKNNEIITYFVRERLNFPGFQGFFVASLFAGSLSSLSSGLNAASAILWKDTIKPLLRSEVSEVKAVVISKMIVVVFGVVSMIWCYTLYTIGGLILQLSYTIDASMFGAYLALFFVALLFRHTSHKGVLAGLLISFALTLWLGMSSLLHGSASRTTLPTTTETCASLTSNETLGNSSSLMSTAEPEDTPCRSFFEQLNSISYEWLIVICVSVSLLVSLCVSGCTGPMSKRRVDEALLFPMCRRGYWPRFCEKAAMESEENSDDERQALDADRCEEIAMQDRC